MPPSDERESTVSESEHNSVVDVVRLFEYYHDELGGEAGESKGRIHRREPCGIPRAIREVQVNP